MVRKYPSGEEIHAGDQIVFSNGMPARVVFVVELKEYTPEYPEADWNFVDGGIGVVHSNQNLMVYDEFCESDEIRLVKRG
jgi:hypothetical protein